MAAALGQMYFAEQAHAVILAWRLGVEQEANAKLKREVPAGHLSASHTCMLDLQTRTDACNGIVLLV